MEIIAAFTQCSIDIISLSERPLKKGLFLRIGKYFFNIISPVRNQTYKLYLSYYSFNRSKRQKYYIFNSDSCFDSFHYSYLSFILQIHYIEKGIFHSVNLNEMIPDFHVNCTWFYITYYTLFLKKCKQFLFFILYASAITHYQLFFSAAPR